MVLIPRANSKDTRLATSGQTEISPADALILAMRAQLHAGSDLRPRKTFEDRLRPEAAPTNAV